MKVDFSVPMDDESELWDGGLEETQIRQGKSGEGKD